jgi:leucyl aminopeptidase (aminopeptidase T)
MKKSSALLVILFCTGFSYGCTAVQRKEILDEAKQYVVDNSKELLEKAVDAGKAYISENAPKIKDAAIAAATEYVDKKLKEVELAELKELDAHLAIHKTVDAEGVESTKTWKDFDADKSGDLGESELAKVGIFITTQTARKVAAGEVSKDEAGKHAKSTGITLAALMAILLGKRAVDKVAKKSPPPGSPTPPSGGPV